MPSAPFEQLRDLILNSTGISWKQVEHIAPALPNVKQLHLCGNGIKSIETASAFVRCYPNLKVINLDDNDIEEWSEVNKLAALPSLEKLHLNQNKISMITHPGMVPLNGDPESTEKGPAFDRLFCLLLANNQLTDWSSIDGMNYFPRHDCPYSVFVIINFKISIFNSQHL